MRTKNRAGIAVKSRVDRTTSIVDRTARKMRECLKLLCALAALIESSASIEDRQLLDGFCFRSAGFE
jgi:hypothetical protein